ncbi:MAG: hypothetical protein FJ100_14455 [Deltaproteobacteria bacterium]|nr:hypothetical protein [Deltaproteobacteria bacterium]
MHPARFDGLGACLALFPTGCIAGGGTVGGSGGGGFAVDAVSGDAGATADTAAPIDAGVDGAAFVRLFVRLYDHTAWAGTATVHVDDWSVVVQ